MNAYIETIKKLNAYNEIEKCLFSCKSPLLAVGVSHIHKAQMIFALSQSTDKPMLVICDDETNCKRLSDDINTMAQNDISFVFHAKELALTEIDTRSHEYEHNRMNVLTKLKFKQCRIIVLSAESAMQYTIPKEVFDNAIFTINNGMEIDIKEISEKLIKGGYKRFDKVEGVSQFSIRGSIIDIFPIGYSSPVRIELWGDEIDSISNFDIETQRRSDSIDSLIIPPATEIIFEADKLVEKISSMQKSLRGKRRDIQSEKLIKDIQKLQNGIIPAGIEKYFNLAYEKPATIFDYLDDNSIVVISEASDCASRAKGAVLQHNEDLNLLVENGNICSAMGSFYNEWQNVVSESVKHQSLFVDNYLHNSNVEFYRIFNITALQSGTWGGEIAQLAEELNNYISSGYSTLVALGSEKTLPTVCEDLKAYKINAEIWNNSSKLIAGGVYLVAGGLSSGYEYADTKCALITATKAHTSLRRKNKKKRKSEEIRSLSDISNGDLIVHTLHGIGRFGGIRKLELEGVVKDYITIQYAGTDVLYVPVTQLDMISKYIGVADEGKVKLSKLSSNEWQKTRKNVKRAVKDMAKELIALYAKREQAKGYAFDIDDECQREFEDRFEYVETDDQLQCIDEIKRDMEKSRPMDRLLCGDVGFGKTEVALRAAFKCVMNGKQCAILAPTTVLAMQHYQTALRRFEHFPVKIAHMSRFCSQRQINENLRKLKNGQVDIVIGTHRLVQKDIKFYDLGLAIIDEEQRFGVAHKERFKEMFTGVDVLTLSATPIPRTLNMAMSGIRDMSVIDEPPQDRYPVQTYVIEHDWSIIAQAIAKELKRGGQAYYIHNRIDSIVSCAGKLQKLLPDARIGIAHGRLSEEEMSEIWRQLVDREIDILVCTTIIETGVDVPNVNTLIIDSADCFGLSQLYQLRGRVGRSTRRAFAYFTFKPGKSLSEVATKRLDTIREFTRFGSGFQIAMRDLEIRGAGDILGGKQHGHMDAVGYDMYLRLLSEAIAEEKGEPLPQESCECLVDVKIDAHIPDKYIESLPQRLDVYRKIATVKNDDDASDLIDELIDRYGDPPRAVLGLIDIAILRNTAASIGVYEISQRGENLLFYTNSATMEQISALSGNFKGRVLYSNMAKPYISVKLAKKQHIDILMKEVLDCMKSAQEFK